MSSFLRATSQKLIPDSPAPSLRSDAMQPAGRAAVILLAISAVLAIGCGSIPTPSRATPSAPPPAVPTPTSAATSEPMSTATAPVPTSRPPATPVAVISRARWNLAPDEHPSPSSTELRVVVYEQGCSSGQAPSEVYEPFVYEDERYVEILFTLVSAPSSGECQPPVGAPMTVTLTEPLRHRDLSDHGGRKLVFQTLRGHPVVWTDALGETATDRVRLMIGADACESIVEGDRPSLFPEELRAINQELPWGHGPVDDGQGFVGSWLDAAIYFGAIEIYSDYRVYNGLVASAVDLGIADPTADASALALTRLNEWHLVDGREVWYPAYLFQPFQGAKLFHAPPCDAN